MSRLLTQRDLSMVIGDEGGNVLMATHAYAELVGRPLDGIVGHCLEEWYHPDDIEKMREVRSKAFRGIPSSYVRKVVKEGETFFATLTLSRISVQKHDLLLGTILPILKVPRDRAVPTAAAMVDYIENMTHGLAWMAEIAGLSSLKDRLEDISLEAVAFSQRLAGRSGLIAPATD